MPAGAGCQSVLSQVRNRQPQEQASQARQAPVSIFRRHPGALEAKEQHTVERVIDEQSALVGAVAPPCDLGIGRRRIDLPAQVDEGRAVLADAHLELRGLVDVRVGVVEAWKGVLRPEAALRGAGPAAPDTGRARPGRRARPRGRSQVMCGRPLRLDEAPDLVDRPQPRRHLVEPHPAQRPLGGLGHASFRREVVLPDVVTHQGET